MASIRAVIAESIAAGAWDNGQFLAERLHSAEKSESSVHLLAQCLHGRGNVNAALMLLRGCQAPENRYLMALCCVSLQLHREAEECLVLNPAAGFANVPRGPYGLTLLGSVYKVLQQRDRAIACFRAALVLEPLMWSAADQLCALGADQDPTEDLLGNAVRQRQQQVPQLSQFVPASPSVFASPAFATPHAYQGALRFALDTPQTVEQRMEEGHDEWQNVVRQFGHIRWLRSQYQPAAVLAAVKLLDDRQRLSPAARIESARAFAEMGDYNVAAREFAHVRKTSPWRGEGMEM
jgi:tetratricopeptide (TPR) repeat protein